MCIHHIPLALSGFAYFLFVFRSQFVLCDVCWFLLIPLPLTFLSPLFSASRVRFLFCAVPSLLLMHFLYSFSMYLNHHPYLHLSISHILPVDLLSTSFHVIFYFFAVYFRSAAASAFNLTVNILQNLQCNSSPLLLFCLKMQVLSVFPF